MAGPVPAHPFARDVIAVTPDGYRFLRIDWPAQPRVRVTHDPMPGDERSEIVQAALDAPSVRGMRAWMRFPSYEVERVGDGWRVSINDVRYSRRDAPIGTAVVELGPDLEPRP